MNEQLIELMERYKTVSKEIDDRKIELSKIRRGINDILESNRYGLLVIPFYHDWKNKGITSI